MKGAPGGFTLWNARRWRAGQADSTGFTIIEVMIVLGISAVMLTSAITIFSSRRESTYFSQAVYDLRSELQSLANNVSSHSLPNLDQYYCQLTDDNSLPDPQYVERQYEFQPSLELGNTVGNDCIFLGVAIQAAANKTYFYSYPVYGLREVYIFRDNTHATPTTPNEAHAEVAINSGGGVILPLQTNYTLLNGAKILWVKPSGSGVPSPAPETDILTMYANLQSNNTSGNDLSVSANPIIGSLPNSPNASMGVRRSTGEQARICVESDRTIPPKTCLVSNQIQILNNKFLNICVGYGTRQAKISLTGTPTGITTALNMNGCT